MSLLVHLSPRVLRIGDSWERTEKAAQFLSKVAGPPSLGPGAPWYSLLQDLHSRFPVQIGQRVDDMNHHSRCTFFHSTSFSVENDMYASKRVVSPWADALRESKSTVAASHPPLLLAMRRELLEQGMSFESASSVRDVGLDATAGRGDLLNSKRKESGNAVREACTSR